MKPKHLIEAFFVKALYYLFGILPIAAASNIAAFIGKSLYSTLKVNKRARANLAMAFPDKSSEQIEQIVKEMWEHLARVVGEFPHMAKITGEDFDKIIEVEGVENLDLQGKREKGAIFFSGHLGNWEFIPKILHEKTEKNAYLVYRKANNPFVDKLITDNRTKYPATSIPKGSVGARQLIKAIQKNGNVGMLVDQKQNDGIAVPFFGRDAMTAPAIANLALKYGCDLIPIQIIRTKGAKFKAKIHKPLNIEKTEDTEKDAYKIMCEINNIIEGWISENPEQWFWVHNRWPKEPKR